MLIKRLSVLCVAAGMAFSSVSPVYAEESVVSDILSGGGNRPAPPQGEPPKLTNGEKPEGESISLPFADVSSDAWYYDTIFQAYKMGYISGMSEKVFAPLNNVTAAQLLSILYRADGNNSDTTEAQQGNWYDTAVSWAKENSIILSDDGWFFEPNAALTREQMMVILYRFMTYKGENLSTENDLLAFDDADKISSYAINAVKGLVSKGIISGDGTSLNPQAALTRAETSVIIVKALGRGGDQQKPNGFGDSAEILQGSAAGMINAESTDTKTSYSSSGNDENALCIDGVSVTLDGIFVNKSGGNSSNTESGDFYGTNAAVLATNGANATITNSEVKSSAKNGNGIFSYGSGTIVNVSDTKINTADDNSGGIQTTGGATTNASNLTINTDGNSSAAIRSDRGGGVVNVNKGSYVSNGYNSPAVYSTADISIFNAQLKANNSEALVIEGKNSITLENCEVSGNMSDTNSTSSNENVHNVMIYQSMSGDADVGTSVFNMSGGTLTGNNGDMFYITNTHSIVNLSNVSINNNGNGCLMRISGNSASHGWGNAGSNGAQVEFTADSQKLNGDIVVDTISTLNMTLSNNSEFSGAINIIDNAQGGAAADNISVTISADSVWNLTGDCVVTSLVNYGTINYNGYDITYVGDEDN